MGGIKTDMHCRLWGDGSRVSGASGVLFITKMTERDAVSGAADARVFVPYFQAPGAMYISLCGGNGSYMCVIRTPKPNITSQQAFFSKYAVTFQVCGQPELDAIHLDKNCQNHCTRSQAFPPQQGSPGEAASSCSKGVNVPN